MSTESHPLERNGGQRAPGNFGKKKGFLINAHDLEILLDGVRSVMGYGGIIRI